MAAPAGSLQELVQRVAGRKVELRHGAHLDSDLGLSSLERVELMSALEDRYQVDLSDREFSRVNTVAELEELVTKSPPAEKPQPYPYSRSLRST